MIKCFEGIGLSRVQELLRDMTQRGLISIPQAAEILNYRFGGECDGIMIGNYGIEVELELVENLGLGNNKFNLTIDAGRSANARLFLEAHQYGAMTVEEITRRWPRLGAMLQEDTRQHPNLKLLLL